MTHTIHLTAVLRALRAHRGAQDISAADARSEIEHALARLQTGFAGLDSTELAWRLERETGCTLEELAAEAAHWTPDLTE